MVNDGLKIGVDRVAEDNSLKDLKLFNTVFESKKLLLFRIGVAKRIL